MPTEAAILRPWIRASYSAALLVALKSSCRTYFSYSPLGEMKRMPAPAPSRLRAPSKYMTRCLGHSSGGGSWISVHSAMKSSRACDLMVERGRNSMDRAPSSTDHLTTRPLASLLWSMLPSGKEETTLTLCAWK